MAKQLQLEGLVAKRADSIYQPGVRSGDWGKDQAQRCRAGREIQAVLRSSTSVSGSKGLLLLFLTGTLKPHEDTYLCRRRLKN